MLEETGCCNRDRLCGVTGGGGVTWPLANLTPHAELTAPPACLAPAGLETPCLLTLTYLLAAPVYMLWALGLSGTQTMVQGRRGLGRKGVSVGHFTVTG